MTFETGREAIRFAERAFVAVVLWQFLASWGMLHLGLRVTIRQSRVKCWGSLALAVGSNIALGAGLVVAFIVAIVINSPSPADTVVMVPVLGLGIGAMMSCLFIKAAFSVSFARAARAWSWMLAATAVSVVVLALVVQPAFRRGTEREQDVCMYNQHRICSQLKHYRRYNDNKWPASLDALLAEEYGLSPVNLHCPLFRATSLLAVRKFDYFYLPPVDDDPNRIILCDFRGNHSSGGRFVVQIGRDEFLRPVPMSEYQFQAELTKRVNAAFAEALRQAEGGAATSPAGRE